MHGNAPGLEMQCKTLICSMAEHDPCQWCHTANGGMECIAAEVDLGSLGAAGAQHPHSGQFWASVFK